VISALDSGEDLPEQMLKQIQDLDNAMTPNDSTNFWTVEMLNAINRMATLKLVSCQTEMGLPESSYLNRLRSYVDQVIPIIRQYAKDQNHAELVVARFAWAMQPRVKRNTPMPLMTQFVLEATITSTEAVAIGTSEVSFLLSEDDFICSGAVVMY